jgi:YD repeat-containing protein
VNKHHSLPLLAILCLAQGLPAKAQTYSYDAAGRLTRVAYPNGFGLQYAYDLTDNLISVSSLTLPPPPSNITAVRTASGTRIEWQANTAGLTEFVILRRASGNAEWQQIATVGGGTRQFIDTTANDPSADYSYRIASRTNSGLSAHSMDVRLSTNSSVPLNVSALGARSLSTMGATPTVVAGYSTVEIDAGSAPYATAVFRLRQNGVIITEVGVPASPPTNKSRIFIEYRTGVTSAANHFAGSLEINTGMAIVNPGQRAAKIALTLKGVDGGVLAAGSTSIAAGAHVARFVSELSSIAPAFGIPADFASATGFAVLDIDSDQPISTMGLRMTLNQRGEPLFTSTPVSDPSLTPDSSPVYFPQFVDGGGYTTSLALLNTSAELQQGTLEIFDSTGARLEVTPVGQTAGSSFNFSIAAGSFILFETDGRPSAIRAGWARWTPLPGRRSPAGAGVFRLAQGGIVVSESGIPSAALTTRARIYVDTSASRDTGIAVANPNNVPSTLTVRAYDIDGTTPVSPATPVDLEALGHRARFAGQLVSGLPAGFIGVLDLESATPFAALTLRLTTNTRGEALMSTFPVANQLRAAPFPIVFPQIADGGGYETELIFAGSVDASNVVVRLFNSNGTPMPVAQLP